MGKGYPNITKVLNSKQHDISLSDAQKSAINNLSDEDKTKLESNLSLVEARIQFLLTMFHDILSLNEWILLTSDKIQSLINITKTNTQYPKLRAGLIEKRDHLNPIEILSLSEEQRHIVELLLEHPNDDVRNCIQEQLRSKQWTLNTLATLTHEQKINLGRVEDYTKLHVPLSELQHVIPLLTLLSLEEEAHHLLCVKDAIRFPIIEALLDKSLSIDEFHELAHQLHDLKGVDTTADKQNLLEFVRRELSLLEQGKQFKWLHTTYSETLPLLLELVSKQIYSPSEARKLPKETLAALKIIQGSQFLADAIRSVDARGYQIILDKIHPLVALQEAIEPIQEAGIKNAFIDLCNYLTIEHQNNENIAPGRALIIAHFTDLATVVSNTPLLPIDDIQNSRIALNQALFGKPPMSKTATLAIGAIFGALLGFTLGFIIGLGITGGFASIPTAILGFKVGSTLGVATLSTSALTSAAGAISGFFYGSFNQQAREEQEADGRDLMTIPSEGIFATLENYTRTSERVDSSSPTQTLINH